jgi:hypothetical protein
MNWLPIKTDILGGTMKPSRHLILVLTALGSLAMLSTTSTAQEIKKNDDKPKSETRELKPVPVKVQIVFTEFDGDKKVKSLPYTALISVDHGPEWAKIRVGTRVPIYAGGSQGGMQYVDIGTNIDCRAHRINDINFDVQLSFERSWVDGDIPLPFDKSSQAANGPALTQFNEPIIRQIKAELNLIMHDGQTVDSMIGTDPMTGRVSKIEVSFIVVK